MLSIETVPTSGDAAAADEDSALFVSAAPHAVAVADRDRGEPRVALGDEPPPVARALARRARLTSAT